MNIDRKAQRLSARNWATIKMRWLAFLPSFVGQGLAPATNLSDFPGLYAHLSQVQDEGEVRGEIAGYREEVFREAVFMLHKAAHVIGAAQKHIQSGLLSWALSDAYQGAFFGIKALFGLLGVSFVEINNRHFMIDVWPGAQKGQRQKRRSVTGAGDTEMQFQRLPIMQHREFWKLFRRLIDVAEVETSLWDQTTIECLLDLSTPDFAAQRNRIHYRNNYWPMPDLHSYVLDQTFGRLNLILSPRLDVEQRDFSARLSYIILNMAYVLFKDVSGFAIGLREEMDILAVSLGRDCHEFYRETYTV